MRPEIVVNQWKRIRGSMRRMGFVILAVFWIAACSGQPAKPVASPTAVQDLPAISQPTETVASPAVGQDQPATSQPAETLASPTAAPDLPASSPTPQATQSLAAQPVSSAPLCKSPATLTPALTEGPYFTANSPERASLLEANTAGIQITLTGYVLTADCQPVAHALLDFWQADAAGQYDNAGYTLRGHQYTDENGRYQLLTVVPGLYPGRTEHIHFKVQAPNGPVLTSQLFFPGVPDNEGDSIFDPALVIQITQESSSSIQATYNFVIQP